MLGTKSKTTDLSKDSRPKARPEQSKQLRLNIEVIWKTTSYRTTQHKQRFTPF